MSFSIMQNSNIQEQKEEKHLNEIVAFATEVWNSTPMSRFANLSNPQMLHKKTHAMNGIEWWYPSVFYYYLHIRFLLLLSF